MLSNFLLDVTEPDQALLSPKRMSAALHISIGELSNVVHIHRNTLASKPDSEKVQDRLGQIARIIALASTLVGDQNKAIIWFLHQPLAGFDNKTAIELVTEGHADAVLKHLDMLSDGGYA